MPRPALALLALGLLLVASAPAPAPPATDREILQGDWTNESFLLDGGPLPADWQAPDRLLTFEGDTFRERRNGKVAVRCTYVLDPTKTPKTIDVTFVEGGPKGRTIKGIYKLEGDTLTSCCGTPRSERPTKFESTADSDLRLVVYKKVKPAAR